MLARELAKNKYYAKKKDRATIGAVATRAYGQYCGFARALEVVGERWALLILRDLLIGPERFSDLQRGLPGIPSNVLTARLKELEESGLVQRRALPRPSGGVVYELTDEGRALEDAIVAIGRWGAKRLGDRRAGEVVTEDSIASALRTTFRPDAAGGDDLTFELHVNEIVVHAHVHDGRVTMGRGPAQRADLIIGTEVLRELLAGEISPRAAIADGHVRISGKRALLDRFLALFRI
jgi:DNA-binding HxlR family transcriptional regulator